MIIMGAYTKEGDVVVHGSGIMMVTRKGSEYTEVWDEDGSVMFGKLRSPASLEDANAMLEAYSTGFFEGIKRGELALAAKLRGLLRIPEPEAEPCK